MNFLLSNTFGLINRFGLSPNSISIIKLVWNGIYSISDLIDALDPNNIRIKTFEDLVFDFQISEKYRRKYNFLLKYIPSIWLDFPGIQTDDIYQRIIDNLIFAGKNFKIPNECADSNLDDEEWKEIHTRNFKCTIESKLRSFYFKVFHKAIAFKDFLFKINRTDSPDCSFCHKKPETIIHIFSVCDLVTPLWQEINTIFDIQNDNIVSDNFSKYLVFREIHFLLIYFFVLNIIFIYASSRTRTLMFVVKKLFSKPKEILNIILPEKRKTLWPPKKVGCN